MDNTKVNTGFDTNDPENEPCKGCGRKDLPLHPNRLCPECYDPDKVKAKEPPTCGSCGEPLLTVSYETVERWSFNPYTGKYDLVVTSQEAVAKCIHCGESLDDVFPDGPTNYEDERENERLLREELKATEGKPVPDYDPTWLRFK